MDGMTQNEVFALIARINDFADRSETLINNTRATYARNKQTLLDRQTSMLSQMETNYRNSHEAVAARTKQTLQEAQQMLADMEALDGHMTRVDKYYRRTRERKEIELSDTISNQYEDVNDYFALLEKIKTDYMAISKKYAEEILPGLLNGLHYFFSTRRKQEYEELIILCNTLHWFEQEIERTLPELAHEEFARQKKEYFAKRSFMLENHKKEQEKLEQEYNAALDEVADRMCRALDEVLPDSLVSSLQACMAGYEKNWDKVNTGRQIENGILHISYVDYPVDYFVQSKIVASLIKEKCAPILVQDSIRLPIMLTTRHAPPWFVVADSGNHTALQAFSHGIMFSVLSACPVEKLVFTIVDPENRGNSIAPYFDAKKKLPELFGPRLLIEREQIFEKLQQLNARIEDILQDKLGTSYETIYDYAGANPSYEVVSELMVLYDFPKGFDEQGLAALRNILRNGSRCGIYLLILYSPAKETGREEFMQSLKTIESLSVTITQQGDQFVMRGMPMVYHSMPGKTDFSRFFSKYMLIFEGIRNRGIAFSPLIKKLVDARSREELEQHIRLIGHMLEDSRKQYGRLPAMDSTFPQNITMGEVSYPADIFSDSIGFDRIRDVFGQGADAGHIALPLTFDLRSAFNILLNAPEKNSTAIRAFTHHVIGSMLSSLPVTKVHFCILDSEQRGNSILPFLDFSKQLPEIFSNKIYTGQDMIQDKLRDMNAQIDDFILNKLGTRYRNLLEYNQNTPNRAEPVTLLVIYDFPAGMDGRSIDLLINILRNGNKCGIYTLICHNPDVVFSRYESLDDRLEQIARYCVSMDYKDNQYLLMPYGLPVQLPPPLDMRAIDSFAAAYVQAAQVIKNKGLAFSDILAPELFARNSAHSLEIPIGLGDEDAIVSLKLGEGTSHHVLIGGGTGGGKSTLLHTLIMSSMLHYSPSQLHLYLMDFKGGTEFKVYETERLPHIQLLALDAMQEFGESILQNLVEEMEKRSNEFKNAGGYTKVEDYVRGTGKPMPRILVIMDEFQILFDDSTNRKVAMRSANHAKRIVTEGRAYGVHLIMATQSTNIISTLTLDRGTIEQMRVRIGLKCGEDDARYLFSDRYERDALAKMVGPKGTAVMNLDYTEQYGNIGLRVAFCDNESKARYLKQISERFADEPCHTQIFEGSRTEPLLDYFASRHITRTDKLPVRIHMGNTIKVADPFEIVVDRKRKHNLLVCGSNERMADNVVNGYMVSAVLHTRASLYCIDGDSLVGDDVSADFYQVLQAHCSNFHLARSRADIVRFIHDVYDIYTERKRSNENGIIFLIIKNLQFLDIVKSMLKGETVDESEYLDEAPEAAPAVDDADPFAALNSFISSRSSGGSDNLTASNEKLLKLIEDGSGFGIHLIISSLEYQTVRDSMYYGENTLAKFPERIIFALNNNDADNLVEGVSVSGLRDNTVYFTDGVKGAYQLKPYIAPTAQELDSFLSAQS